MLLSDKYCTFSVRIVCSSRSVIIVDAVRRRSLIFYKLATLRATAHSRPSSLHRLYNISMLQTRKSSVRLIRSFLHPTQDSRTNSSCFLHAAVAETDADSDNNHRFWARRSIKCASRADGYVETTAAVSRWQIVKQPHEVCPHHCSHNSITSA